MKKKMIAASVASLALAAMPVVGVFAQAANPSNFVDILQVTIADSCNWTRTMTAGDANTTVTNADAATATAARTMTAGQSVATFATSAFNAKCNNDAGYTITATMTNLGGYTSNSKGTSITDNIAYASDDTLSEGTWVATLSDEESSLDSGVTGNVANTTEGDDMGDGSSYTITYGVQTAANQSAGYYEGTATYVFVQK